MRDTLQNKAVRQEEGSDTQKYVEMKEQEPHEGTWSGSSGVQMLSGSLFQRDAGDL